MKQLFAALFILFLPFTSCKNEEQVPQGEFSSGVYIINEGNFSESNGSIGFYNLTTQESAKDVFKDVNGVAPGGILQSMYIHENLAFFIDQVGNTIHVVDANTFESIATIDAGLSTPRYMIVNNGKGYVSNWGPFDENFNLTASYVAIIDMTSYEVIETVEVESGAEALSKFGGNVYVSNSFSNTIQEIDSDSQSIVNTIEVAEGPISFAFDKNDKLWVLSSSYFAGAALTQVDLRTNDLIKSFIISPFAKSLTIGTKGDELYYLSAPFEGDAEVKKLSIDATKDSETVLIQGANLYGLGIDPETGIIYVANNNAFQGNGTIIRYNQGELIDSFGAGVAPNGFVFRP